MGVKTHPQSVSTNERINEMKVTVITYYKADTCDHYVVVKRGYLSDEERQETAEGLGCPFRRGIDWWSNASEEMEEKVLYNEDDKKEIYFCDTGLKIFFPSGIDWIDYCKRNKSISKSLV